MSIPEPINRGAVLSGDFRYRYCLSRAWGKDGLVQGYGTDKEVLFVGLNPSTADAEKDDATVRRLMFAANANGYNAFQLVNLFAYRAANPKRLRNTSGDIVGDPKNKNTIRQLATRIRDVVFIYGAFWQTKWLPNKIIENTFKLFDSSNRLLCFGVTNQGRPKHPLYLSNETVSKLQPFPLVRV